MKKVFANLCGNWVNLNEDPNCKMDTNMLHPSIWMKEDVYKMFEYNHININYNGVDYRIHPSFIQITS